MNYLVALVTALLDLARTRSTSMTSGWQILVHLRISVPLHRPSTLPFYTSPATSAV